MQDPFGHLISYLRVSITDRCNERCVYCMPQETQEWLPRDEVLTYEELARIVRVGASLGVSKLRVTGGEPLARAGVLDFFALLEEIPEIRDLGISTNGSLLAQPVRTRGGRTMAECLRGHGVRTVNISLDTLDRSTYWGSPAATCSRKPSKGSPLPVRRASGRTRSSSTACSCAAGMRTNSSR